VDYVCDDDSRGEGEERERGRKEKVARGCGRGLRVAGVGASV